MKEKRRIPRFVKIPLALVVLAAILYFPLKEFLIYKVGISELNMGGNLILQRLGWVSVADAPGLDQVTSVPTNIELDESIIPFREIGHRLGPRGLASNIFVPHGAAIFDANGDGRLDIYMAHQGRTVAKWTSPDHVLKPNERMPAKPCTLFLNLGNDAAGDPVFKSLQDLMAEGNDRYVQEELLIENKYRPRSSLETDELGPGRIASAAIAADFNGDGRVDLYVLNSHWGIGFQTDQLGLRAYPARENLGRESRKDREALVIRVPSFLWGEREDGMVTTVDFGEKPEAEGRNSLYLNRGDKDGDGLPEWQDVTDEMGVGGRWASVSGAVADVDRDGDLDLYVANFVDPDFWGFGDNRFAGNRNQLYVNQLADTGELSFRNMAEEWGVAGLHDEEGLESSLYFPTLGKHVPVSEHIVEGRQVGEKADHSWAVMFSDWSKDGWPDLVVANDLTNRLRVYENRKGQGFRRLEEFDESLWNGCWMGMSAGDLDGDLNEEMLITNCGSQVMSVRNTAMWIEDETEANVQALAAINYVLGHTTLHHTLLSYQPDGTFRELSTDVTLHHSPYIPPDMSLAANFPTDHLDFYEKYKFGTSMTSLEFAWNAPMFDVDNDGDLDLYLAGSLARGNDDFVGDWSGSPGRMLVNESTPGSFVFRDLTLEYQLLDITHLDYTSNPPRRPSPGTGWHKRDYIYITDTDGYAGMGVGASDSAIHDIFRMHEAAHAVLIADLNRDGFEDIVVTHVGGYESHSPDARNLKVEFAGRTLAVPAPNKLNKAPTNFEEGATFVYINGGAPQGSAGHWVKVRLIDRGSYNRYSIGARVIANDRIKRHLLVGGTAFGATTGDLHLGLGSEPLRSLEITWPSADMTPKRLVFDPPVVDEVVCVDREHGVVSCDSAAAPESKTSS